jgi:N-acetylneuraminate lyase
MNFRLHELVPATHTPFEASGALNLAAIERQAQHLLADGVRTAFIGGTTGECHSLTLDERRALATRWTEVTRGTALRIIVHVGSNSLADARMLATQAQELGAVAISALSPSYFKPRNVEDLVACCQRIAAAAPALPFYYYDIPSLTGVTLSPPEFLSVAADTIPTLAGIKFTNPDLMAYQRCLHSRDGRFDVPWGTDESLLGALALGAAGAVGSTYNFAAPLYLRMWDAFSRGDLAAARIEQYRSVELITSLASYGYMGAAKALMGLIGVDVGAPRLPNAELPPPKLSRLVERLDAIGFFGWRGRDPSTS